MTRHGNSATEPPQIRRGPVADVVASLPRHAGKAAPRRPVGLVQTSVWKYWRSRRSRAGRAIAGSTHIATSQLQSLRDIADTYSMSVPAGHRCDPEGRARSQEATDYSNRY